MVCSLFCVSWAGDGHLYPPGRCEPLSGNARLNGTRIFPHSLDPNQIRKSEVLRFAGKKGIHA